MHLYMTRGRSGISFTEQQRHVNCKNLKDVNGKAMQKLILPNNIFHSFKRLRETARTKHLHWTSLVSLEGALNQLVEKV